MRIGRISRQDWFAILILVLLAAWLFRGHVLGDTIWIGNPDRLNSDLKVHKHYVTGAAQGALSAWNEHEMMGYDSFAMPYIFPNPLVGLAGAVGAQHLFVTMGFAMIVLLIASGVAAYCFIRSYLPAGAPATVGAICYQFSALALLKASQNSMSFAVFIVIPLLLLAVRHLRRETAAGSFVVLAFLFGAMLSLMFLQKAAYAGMLATAYAAWRSLNDRSWLHVTVVSMALAVATVFSAPRIIGIADAMGQYTRAVEGHDFKSYATLYRFQNIRPREILRWFDDTMFGRSPSEAVKLGNDINLTEGFLLYTSAIVPMLLVLGLTLRRRQWLHAFRPPRDDAAFFFWALLACTAVIVVKPIGHVVFLLFLRMDFTHARILVSALLPLCLLVALALTDLSTRHNDGSRRAAFAGGIAGLLASLAIDVLAELTSGHWQAGFGQLRYAALLRVALSGVFFGVVAWTILRTSRHAVLARLSYWAICSFLVAQCLLGANQQVNGVFALDITHPFKYGNLYQARAAEFQPPTEQQLRILHQRIEPNRFRVALVCDRSIAGGLCAGHVPEFWQLRTIDGYYGLGVPARLRALPWPSGVGLRTISFVDLTQVPWDLLGLLNVSSVLVSGDGTFRNIVRDGERILGPADPTTFRLVPSPARVTPRAFFAASIRPAASASDAVGGLFRADGIVDPRKTSFVEGLQSPRQLEEGGPVDITGRGDSIELRFAPSSSERFLVLNELYYRGWRASVSGLDLPIMPTNAVMRGILVPPGADHVRFSYQSYAMTIQAWWWRAVALLALAGLTLVLRRHAIR